MKQRYLSADITQMHLLVAADWFLNAILIKKLIPADAPTSCHQLWVLKFCVVYNCVNWIVEWNRKESDFLDLIMKVPVNDDIRIVASSESYRWEENLVNILNLYFKFCHFLFVNNIQNLFYVVIVDLFPCANEIKYTCKPQYPKCQPNNRIWGCCVITYVSYDIKNDWK